MILPASEISRVSIATPAAFVNVFITGRKEYVAKAGASSTFV